MMVPPSLLYYLIITPLVLPIVLVACSTNGNNVDSSSQTSTSSMPRSAQREDAHAYRFPPWNPSPNIDDDGFLNLHYKRVPGEWEKDVKLSSSSTFTISRSSSLSKHLKKRQVPTLQQPPIDWPCRIRQVPGDGNCLFHSISTCYAHAVNGTHLDMSSQNNNIESLQWLYHNSAILRQQAVDCLEQKRKLLFLQGQEYLRAQDLVDAAASQFDISGPEYCRLMRQDSYWGGGPEIVALCNVLQRPIHVYELFVDDCTNKNEFVLRRMACFGSPRYDKQSALHILSADSRFPDLQPGKQEAAGNHFLAVFPEDVKQHSSSTLEYKKKKKPRIRGGDSEQQQQPNQ
jgi:OTU-like cysteine protease